MTDARRIAEETLALDAKATAGPWFLVDHPRDEWTIQDQDGGGDTLIAQCYIKSERVQGELIAHYRTSAPALARAVLDYEKKLREADAALIAGTSSDPKISANEYVDALNQALAREEARARETSRTAGENG